MIICGDIMSIRKLKSCFLLTQLFRAAVIGINIGKKVKFSSFSVTSPVQTTEDDIKTFCKENMVPTKFLGCKNNYELLKSTGKVLKRELNW